MKRLILCCSLLAFGYISFPSCKKLEPQTPPDDSILDGPVEGLTSAQKQAFLRGDAAFNAQVFTKETGLGPLFVAASCGSCHAGDGKGHPFTTLTRFGQTDSTGNKFASHGGPQLQNRAITGYEPEQIPTGATSTRLTPPANTGLGYIDAVTDATILAMADPEDADGDGISGVPNWISLKSFVTPRPGSSTNGGRHIGRFGKKAAAYNLLQQTAAAYNQDMGITSIYEPFDTYSGLETSPEVSAETVHDVILYLRSLKAPIQRSTTDPDVIAGKAIFMQTDCGKCHRPELTTGESPIAAISHQTFYPYTDLLLHDMGPGLDDGYTEGNAKTAEWRTPALWGLGLSKNSQGGAYYLMHDGRARDIAGAIALHGGEATGSRAKYNALTNTDKQKLIKFLESL